MDESTWIDIIVTFLLHIIEAIIKAVKEENSYQWIFSGVGLSVMSLLSMLLFYKIIRRRDAEFFNRFFKTQKEKNTNGNDKGGINVSGTVSGDIINPINTDDGTIEVNIGNTTTHIHNDVPNDQLVSMEAKLEAKLNEIASKLNTTPETLTTELDITKSALVSFFKILEQKDAPPN